MWQSKLIVGLFSERLQYVLTGSASFCRCIAAKHTIPSFGFFVTQNVSLYLNCSSNQFKDKFSIALHTFSDTIVVLRHLI